MASIICERRARTAHEHPNQLAVDVEAARSLVAEPFPPWAEGPVRLGPADPALELVGARHFLEAGPRRAFRDDLGCDDFEWERGQAWAFEQAMGLVWYHETSKPTMAAAGRRTLYRLLPPRS